jgi:hypothetical protein
MVLPAIIIWAFPKICIRHIVIFYYFDDNPISHAKTYLGHALIRIAGSTIWQCLPGTPSGFHSH